jgi:hypothetical protein
MLSQLSLRTPTASFVTETVGGTLARSSSSSSRSCHRCNNRASTSTILFFWSTLDLALPPIIDVWNTGRRLHSQRKRTHMYLSSIFEVSEGVALALGRLQQCNRLRTFSRRTNSPCRQRQQSSIHRFRADSIPEPFQFIVTVL